MAHILGYIRADDRHAIGIIDWNRGRYTLMVAQSTDWRLSMVEGIVNAARRYVAVDRHIARYYDSKDRGAYDDELHVEHSWWILVLESGPVD
jgi:hypothetical protein